MCKSYHTKAARNVRSRNFPNSKHVSVISNYYSSNVSRAPSVSKTYICWKLLVQIWTNSVCLRTCIMQRGVLHKIWCSKFTPSVERTILGNWPCCEHWEFLNVHQVVGNNCLMCDGQIYSFPNQILLSIIILCSLLWNLLASVQE